MGVPPALPAPKQPNALPAPSVQPEGTPEFTFKDQKVRVAMIAGEPWFVASDVRRVLGIAQSGNNFAFPAKDETCLAPRGLITGAGMNQATLLSESGLYKFVMRSDKPEAKAFQDWVTREVLPSIRRTGSYCQPN